MIRHRRLCRWFGCKLGPVGFKLFELEFELFNLPLDLLRAAPELHAPQLGDEQFQMLDLALVGDQLRVLQTDHRLQGCGIESIQIGQQERHLAHARSMPRSWVSVMHKRCVNTEQSRTKT